MDASERKLDRNSAGRYLIFSLLLVLYAVLIVLCIVAAYFSFILFQGLLALHADDKMAGITVVVLAIAVPIVWLCALVVWLVIVFVKKRFRERSVGASE